MKTIKFRAYDKLNNKFLYSEDVGFTAFWAHVENLDSYKPVEFFSGIKDKYGTEVFEGDIICYLDEDMDEQHWVVIFDDGCFILNDSAIWDYLRYDKDNQPTDQLEPNLEVVGNIYENKELTDAA